MKATPRRKRSDSIAAETAAFRNAVLGPINPPSTVKLRDGDRPIWDAIVCARAREEWSDIDLHHAANLTRCFSDIERISSELQDGGDTLVTERGTVHVNPRHNVLETLSRRAVSLTRLLHLHASVLVGSPDRVANGRALEQQVKRTVAKDDDDGLLATPTVQ